MRRTVALVLGAGIAVLVLLLLRGGCGEERDRRDGDRAVPEGAARSLPAPPRRAPAERAARPAEESGGPGDVEAVPASRGPVAADGPATADPPREAPAADTGPFPEGEIPEADRGRGECALAIDLRDAATGRPHAGRARLWRLGVAADARWPAGDHVQLTLDSNQRPAGVLRDLPAGRYRLEVLSAAPGTEDPPEFLVEGAHTNLRADVTAPPMLPVRLRIFDETGEPILAAKSSYRSPGGSGTRPLRGPAWTSPRNPAPAEFVDARAGMWGWRSGRRHEASNPLTADRDGAFLLGEVQGPARDHSWTASWTLRIDGHSGVRVTAASDDAARGEFVAVAVAASRIDEIADEVFRLPDGTPARAAGARVEATCSAVAHDPGTTDDAWTKLPVRVSVSLAGYEDASVDWRPSGPVPEPFAMTPKPVK